LDLGIASELTPRQRYRVHSYRRYVKLLNAELPTAPSVAA
jgi:hypothetical protein